MKMKASAQALREFKTNEEVVHDIMNFSRYGALCQAFVISALEQYCKRVGAASEASLQTDFMPPGVWKGIGAEVLAKLQAAGYVIADDKNLAVSVGMETVVILHATTGDIRTSYPASKQADAIALWKDYVASGKRASLLVE